MIRLLISSTAAVVLLAAPVAASAATAKHAGTKATHHMSKASSKPGKHARSGSMRDGGSAAVDS